MKEGVVSIIVSEGVVSCLSLLKDLTLFLEVPKVMYCNLKSGIVFIPVGCQCCLQVVWEDATGIAWVQVQI